MADREKFGYWKIFREIFWTSLKAFLILSFFSILKTSIIFIQAGAEGGIINLLSASVLMHLMGLIIVIPLIAVFILTIGTPLALIFYRKKWWDVYKLTMFSAIISLLLLKLAPELADQEIFSKKDLITGNLEYIFGGGLTGYFLFKQTEHWVSASDNFDR